MAGIWQRLTAWGRQRFGRVSKSDAAAMSIAGMTIVQRADVMRKVIINEGRARAAVVAAAVAKAGSIDPAGTPPSTSEIGVTGLQQWSGYIDEEFLPQLRGKRALEVFKEMSRNDATVGAILFAIQMLIRQVKWRVELSGDDPADVDKGKHLSECMDDMAETWADVIAEILSFLPMGFAVHEPVYKRRLGASLDLKTDSKHEDGRIGWQKIPGRAQETIDRWIFNEESGEVEAAVQRALPHYRDTVLPCSRILLFRATTAKGNPEGLSILRTAYLAWYHKKRIEVSEGIGIERELAGMPKVGVPIELFHPDATAPQKKLLADMQEMARNVRLDEQAGIVYPREFDGNGKERYSFDLLTSGGARRVDTNAVVNRYDKRIAQTVLADFILMGQENVGSFALASSKTKLFAAAAGSWIDSIEQTFNRQAIPALFRLNDFPETEKLPELKHEDIETADLIELADYVGKLVNVGALNIEPEDEVFENYLRDQAGLPHRSDNFEKPEPPPVPSFFGRPPPPPPGVGPGDDPPPEPGKDEEAA